jgi:hypothetical protein
MRKPKSATPSGHDTPPPAGGRALGRAAQFTYSRGLTPAVVAGAPVKRKAAAKKAAAVKPAAKKAAAKKAAARKPPAKKPAKA